MQNDKCNFDIYAFDKKNFDLLHIDNNAGMKVRLI